MQSTVNAQFNVETATWPYFVGVLAVLTPIAWVEDIKKFSFTFLVGNLLILLTLVTVSGYCVWLMADQGGLGPPVPAYRPDAFWATVGFAIYSYEGIGIVMPVLAKAEDPDSFIKCLFYAIATLSVLFITFGEITVLAFGSDLTEPFVTQMLPAGNYGVSLIKVLFTLNLICSYPITVNPTNTIIESYMIGPPSIVNGERVRGRCELVTARVSRFMVVFLAGLLGIVLASDMDKFLGFFGALLGSPMAMTLPALIHYKLVAKSRCEKLLDILLIILSGFCLAFSTVMSLQAWAHPADKVST